MSDSPPKRTAEEEAELKTMRKENAAALAAYLDATREVRARIVQEEQDAARHWSICTLFLSVFVFCAAAVTISASIWACVHLWATMGCP